MYCTIVFKEAKARTVPSYARYGISPSTDFEISEIHTGKTIFCRTKNEAQNIAKFLGEECDIVRGSL